MWQQAETPSRKQMIAKVKNIAASLEGSRA